MSSIRLPNNFVMPNEQPPFDYLRLLLEITSSRRFLESSPKNRQAILDNLISSSKQPREMLIRFGETYLEPALRLAAYISRAGIYTGNRPNPSLPVVLDDAANVDESNSMEVAARDTRQFFLIIDRFLKTRQYVKTINDVSSTLSLVDYRPSRRLKTRAEFLPTLTVLTTPDRAFILDIFINTKRIASFEYGLPTYNQINAPPSLLAERPINPHEYVQYSRGLSRALIEISRTVINGINKARLTKYPKLKAKVENNAY